MLIILVVGVSALILFALVFLYVLARLRRVIKSQVDAIEKMAAAVQTSQDQNTPGEPGVGRPSRTTNPPSEGR